MTSLTRVLSSQSKNSCLSTLALTVLSEIKAVWLSVATKHVGSGFVMKKETMDLLPILFFILSKVSIIKLLLILKDSSGISQYSALSVEIQMFLCLVLLKSKMEMTVVLFLFAELHV